MTVGSGLAALYNLALDGMPCWDGRPWRFCRQDPRENAQTCRDMMEEKMDLLEQRWCWNECVSGLDECSAPEPPLSRWEIVGMLAFLLVGAVGLFFGVRWWLVVDRTVVLILLSLGIVGALLFTREGLSALLAFIRQNVVGRSIYFFLTDDGEFHDHLCIPDQEIMRRTTCFVHGRIGGWFRRCELTGPPIANWELVGMWNRKMWVRDKTANRHLLWTDDPEDVLRLITRFVSVEDIVETLKRREQALDELGIGVQYVIAWASAHKDRARSPHAQQLREKLEGELATLHAKHLLPDKLAICWRDEAQARLTEENNEAVVRTEVR